MRCTKKNCEAISLHNFRDLFAVLVPLGYVAQISYRNICLKDSIMISLVQPLAAINILFIAISVNGSALIESVPFMSFSTSILCVSRSSTRPLTPAKTSNIIFESDSSIIPVMRLDTQVELHS